MPALATAPAAFSPALAALAALSLLACSGGAATAPPLAAVPDRATRATLAGPLCEGASCQCREGVVDAGRPDAGKKRFELRLGPADHEVWATVDEMVLYKSRERATDCFYLDLLPGVHHVKLRGAGEPAVGFQASISEQGGTDGQAWWYDTFLFACGSPGPCDRAALDDFKRSMGGHGGKLDPCGSTKVKRAGWHSGRMPDHGSPTDLEVGLELHVYGFAPAHPPGDPSCTGAAEQD
jgi:hypothetical protein